eukprot:g44374.t1
MFVQLEFGLNGYNEFAYAARPAELFQQLLFLFTLSSLFVCHTEPFAESIRKDVSLRRVTVPGSRGLQVKASLHMDDATIFCSEQLTDYLKVLGIFFGEAGACTDSWEECIAKDSVLHGLFPGTHTKTNIDRAWRAINLVKDALWSAQNLLVFQSKELTLTECCRLAHSKVQDYMLRDKLKLGAAAIK